MLDATPRNPSQQNGIFAASLTFNGNNNRIDGATYDEKCESLPFGDDLGPCTLNSYASPLHFTGKEHDYESGLDNFGAR